MYVIHTRCLCEVYWSVMIIMNMKILTRWYRDNDPVPIMIYYDHHFRALAMGGFAASMNSGFCSQSKDRLSSHDDDCVRLQLRSIEYQSQTSFSILWNLSHPPPFHSLSIQVGKKPGLTVTWSKWSSISAAFGIPALRLGMCDIHNLCFSGPSTTIVNSRYFEIMKPGKDRIWMNMIEYYKDIDWYRLQDIAST